MLTENETIDILAEYLKNQDCKIKQKRYSKQTGVDLIVENPNGVEIFIEVKGETSGSKTSKRYGEPFSGKQIWSHVSVALLKTLRDMNKPENNKKLFAMAFPINHEKLLKEIKVHTDKLGIMVYIVSDTNVNVL